MPTQNNLQVTLKDNNYFVIKLAVAGICLLLILTVLNTYVEKEKFFGLVGKVNSINDADFSISLTHTDEQGYFNQYKIDGTKLSSSKQLELNVVQTGNPTTAKIWADETRLCIDSNLFVLLTPILFGDIDSEADYEQIQSQIDVEKFSNIALGAAPNNFWNEDGSINQKFSSLSPILIIDTLLQNTSNINYQNKSITISGTKLSKAIQEFKESWLKNLENTFTESNVTLVDMCTLLFDALPQFEEMTYSVSEKSGVITQRINLSNASDTWVLSIDTWKSFHTVLGTG